MNPMIKFIFSTFPIVIEFPYEEMMDNHRRFVLVQLELPLKMFLILLLK